MQKKIIGFFAGAIAKAPSAPVVVDELDRLMMQKNRTPIGTSIESEHATLIREISELGPDAVKVQLQKEAIELEELTKKIGKIASDSQNVMSSMLGDTSKKSTLKERIKAAHKSIQDQGLDLASNRVLYETQGSLKRRQMVVKMNPGLLSFDYNSNIAGTKH